MTLDEGLMSFRGAPRSLVPIAERAGGWRRLGVYDEWDDLPKSVVGGLAEEPLR